MSCELAVDSIDNKVAFGVAFPDDGDISKQIHGKPMPAGCLRVSVDGWIKEEALIPVPVIGEIETVKQAVGSHVAWPNELIIVRNTEVFFFGKIVYFYFCIMCVCMHGICKNVISIW